MRGSRRKVVNNGFGAGMLAKEYHPDLIILDVMLPDINGQAVCELIRHDPDDGRHQDHLHLGHGRGGQDPGAASNRVPTISCTSRWISMN